MNRTPPSALFTSSFVLMAVAPRYSPTRSARCASTTTGVSSRPKAKKIFATTRATEVFPVPGGPRKTKCCMGFSAPYPAITRRRAASTDAVICRI